jgi:hypothetical protein
MTNPVESKTKKTPAKAQPHEGHAETEPPAFPVRQIFSQLEALINKRATQLCKDFCYHNRYEYTCTVDKNWTLAKEDSALCDWGNASYVWITEDLLKLKSLRELGNESPQSAIKCSSKVLHSQVFKERFKDWRFQRRIRVPDYIKVLDADAKKIYWSLCDNDVPDNIAQQLGRPVSEINIIISQIQKELLKRKKSYLLDNNKVSSLDAAGAEVSAENLTSLIVQQGQSVEGAQLTEAVMQAYAKLDWKEQYIIDAMVIGGLKAASVLEALQSMNVSLDNKTPATELTDQKIYYFLRKTILKLKNLSNL